MGIAEHAPQGHVQLSLLRLLQTCTLLPSMARGLRIGARPGVHSVLFRLSLPQALEEEQKLLLGSQGAEARARGGRQASAAQAFPRGANRRGLLQEGPRESPA